MKWGETPARAPSRVSHLMPSLLRAIADHDVPRRTFLLWLADRIEELELEKDQQERFKWAANARADALEEALRGVAHWHEHFHKGCDGLACSLGRAASLVTPNTASAGTPTEGGAK